MNDRGPERDWVFRYYETVDRGSPDEVAALFATDCEYRRPGYPPLHGRSAVHEFYARHRVIESGSHRLSEVVTESGVGAAIGDFRGVLRSGAAAEVGFADLFVFSVDGLIRWRTTFFFVPML